MEALYAVIGGATGAAAVTGIFSLIQFFIRRKDKSKEKESSQNKALRYLLLYNIQERCKEHIRAGRISIEERRLIHKWHYLYHNELNGNGDADALMREIDNLDVDIDHQ